MLRRVSLEVCRCRRGRRSVVSCLPSGSAVPSDAEPVLSLSNLRQCVLVSSCRTWGQWALRLLRVGCRLRRQVGWAVSALPTVQQGQPSGWGGVRTVRIFTCSRLRYLTPWDSESSPLFWFGRNVGWEKSIKAPRAPWGRGDTHIICHWTIIHQIVEVLAPSQLLSFLRNREPLCQLPDKAMKSFSNSVKCLPNHLAWAYIAL